MEKLRIWCNSFIRSFFYHLFFWCIVLFLYLLLTGQNRVFVSYFPFINPHWTGLNVFCLSLFLSVLFTIFDGFFFDRLLRRLPVSMLLVFRLVLYFILVWFILMLSSQEIPVQKSIDWTKFRVILPELNLPLLRFVVYFLLACLLNGFMKETIKRIGRGNYFRWFFGFMNKPREEERIFMFIDMKSSTATAEKLGHKKFSYLAQDAFNDLSIVDNYNGSIYQYLGDGAIISWSLRKGLPDNNCIHAFFAFERVLQRRARFYKRKYGIVPQFKAGIHCGKIMVLQVGTVRRDISYNGDTLNTTARIESMCNEFQSNLLISGDLYKLISNKKTFSFKALGNIQLKGKKREVELFGVKKKK